MIKKECFTTEWIEQVSSELHYNDKNLIEKVIRALSLLEMLVKAGCPLVFKGLCVAIHKSPFMSSKRLCVVTFCKVLVSCPLARRLPSDTTHNIRRI